MRELCALTYTTCDGVCRRGHKEPEKCPGFFLEVQPKPRKRALRQKRRLERQVDKPVESVPEEAR